MVKSICFTGHRHIAKEKLPAALAELRRVLETAIPQGFVDFYAGGALGWDTYCAQTVLDLREEYPCIALHLVLPCSRAEQTARWTEAQKAAYDCIYREADSCEFVSVDYTKDCMRLRNKRLVELADCCVCFCGEPEGRSGTAQTVRMARQKGIRLSIWHREIQKPRRRDVAFFAYGKGCSVPGSGFFISPEQQTEQPAHQRPDVEHL